MNKNSTQCVLQNYNVWQCHHWFCYNAAQQNSFLFQLVYMFVGHMYLYIYSMCANKSITKHCFLHLLVSRDIYTSYAFCDCINWQRIQQICFDTSLIFISLQFCESKLHTQQKHIYMYIVHVFNSFHVYLSFAFFIQFE